MIRCNIIHYDIIQFIYYIVLYSMYLYHSKFLERFVGVAFFVNKEPSETLEVQALRSR